MAVVSIERLGLSAAKGNGFNHEICNSAGEWVASVVGEEGYWPLAVVMAFSTELLRFVKSIADDDIWPVSERERACALLASIERVAGGKV